MTTQPSEKAYEQQRKDLSIFIPTYNRPEDLARLLTELTCQINQLPKGHDRIEVVVSDNSAENGSTSGIMQKEYFGLKARLAYHRNKHNIGPDMNMLQCFNRTCGKYVWILGDDDLLHDRAVERVYNLSRVSDEGLLRLEETFEERDGTNTKYKHSIYSDGDFEIGYSVAAGSFGPQLNRVSCLVLKRPKDCRLGPMSSTLGRDRFIAPLTLALDAIIEFGPGKGIAGEYVRYVDGDKSGWSDKWPWIHSVNVPIAIKSFASHMGASRIELRRVTKSLTSTRYEAAVEMIVVKASRPKIYRDWLFVLYNYLSDPLFVTALAKRYLVILASKLAIR